MVTTATRIANSPTRNARASRSPRRLVLGAAGRSASPGCCPPRSRVDVAVIGISSAAPSVLPLLGPYPIERSRQRETRNPAASLRFRRSRVMTARHPAGGDGRPSRPRRGPVTALATLGCAASLPRSARRPGPGSRVTTLAPGCFGGVVRGERTSSRPAGHLWRSNASGAREGGPAGRRYAWVMPGRSGARA
jgi:hypothetical protein